VGTLGSGQDEPKQCKIPEDPIGKKKEDSGKNEKHGDGGRAKEKAAKQIRELEEKLKSATGRREKEELKRKMKNIRRNAERQARGEEHSRTKKK
jgi:hypothetical protein